jgi:hypothetical protein
VAQVKNSEGMPVLTAVRKHGLYIVPTKMITCTEANTFQAKRKAMPFEIWHRRLGHIGSEVIGRMVHEGLVDGLEVDGLMEMKAMCEDCIYGTHTTHPFQDSVPPETDILQRVYIDIWGPATVNSAGGVRYFMLLMDGATSYWSIYFLSTKSADVTLHAFWDFHAQAERQTGKKLKRVHLDMGKEWHNSVWDEYVTEHSIVLDFTMPYAHQQNGKAECSRRTLLDTTQTLLADSGLTQKYRADAVQTAIYTRNLVPTLCTPKLIPAEKWTSQRQDLSHLHPFGSVAYAHIPTEVSLSKLSPCSVKLVMIGYYDHTGYKLLDRSTGTAYKSRDVIFEESRPHFTTDPSDENLPLTTQQSIIAP